MTLTTFRITAYKPAQGLPVRSAGGKARGLRACARAGQRRRPWHSRHPCHPAAMTRSSRSRTASPAPSRTPRSRSTEVRCISEVWTELMHAATYIRSLLILLQFRSAVQRPFRSATRRCCVHGAILGNATDRRSPLPFRTPGETGGRACTSLSPKFSEEETNKAQGHH